MKASVVFFGNEKLATGLPAALPLIRETVIAAGFEIEQHVTGPLSDLKSHKSQLAVLAAYGRIISQRVLDEFPLGIINIHPSLLPAYRGPTPIEQAILDGASKTGVSIMRLTAGMDEGPLYKQKTIHMTGTESKAELTDQLQQLGAKLLSEVLSGIADGSLQPRQQPHPSRVTYSHLLTKDSGSIDWNKPAEQLEREIRAFAGWPGSSTTLAGREVTITAAHLVDGSGPAGQTEVHGKELIIFTGNGVLSIDALKPAGKKEMSASEFIRGYLR